MIEHLEQLVKDRQYERALLYAEQLLVSKDNTTIDLLVINCAMLTARFALGQYSGAVIAGDLAVKLGRELEDWDRYGAACFDLGTAYYLLGQLPQAVSVWYEYLSKVQLYRTASRYELNVWFNLGLANTAQDQLTQASQAFTKALDAASRMRDERAAHGIRQTLIGVLIKAKDTAPIPRLMVQCQHYLRRYPDAPGAEESRLWQVKLRVEYSLCTNRLRKAHSLAVRGLAKSEGKHVHQFWFHMVLAEIARRTESPKEALGHSLAARVYAITSQRHDLESQAADLTYEITTRHPDAIQEMNDYYLSGAGALGQSGVGSE